MGGNGSVAKAQLWGLLVVASDDPDLGSEKRADEGKLVDVEARQLGGCDGQDAVASGEWVRVGVSVERELVCVSASRWAWDCLAGRASAGVGGVLRRRHSGWL